MAQDPNPAAVPQPPVEGAVAPGVEQQQQPIGPPVPPPKQLLQNPEFLWTVGLLALVMIGGAIAIGFLDRWRKKQVDPARWKRSGPELGTFREMLDTGEITHSEYERIRDKVSTKMKLEVGLKKPVVPPTGSDDPAGPPPPPAPAPGV